jgi:general secretion pathway protein K
MNKFRNLNVKETTGFDRLRGREFHSMEVRNLEPRPATRLRRAGLIGNSAGVALLMVLWVTAILAVIALEFSFAMRTEVNIARHYKEQTELHARAEGGIQRAIVEMIYKQDARIQQLRKTMKTEGFPPEQEEWVADGRVYPLPFDKGKCDVRMMSEGGKVNINVVSEIALRKIVGQLGLEGETRDVVVDSILDWRDPDDFYRINGAENDYYQSLKEPYKCKNGILDSIEELLLVRGVTQDLFYGKKGEKEGEEGSTDSRVGMKDIFSVYAPGEQVDINSATVPVMKILLGIPNEMAQRIIKAREEKAFERQEDLLLRVPEISSFAGDAMRLIVFKSTIPYYTIEATATNEQGKSARGMRAIIKVDPKEKEGYKVVQWVDALF